MKSFFFLHAVNSNRFFFRIHMFFYNFFYTNTDRLFIKNQETNRILDLNKTKCLYSLQICFLKIIKRRKFISIFLFSFASYFFIFKCRIWSVIYKFIVHNSSRIISKGTNKKNYIKPYFQGMKESVSKSSSFYDIWHSSV